MIFKIELLIFVISFIMFMVMIGNLEKKRKENKDNKLYGVFIALCGEFLIYLSGLIAQIAYLNFGGDAKYAIYFDYFVYLGAMFLPVQFFIIAKRFENSKGSVKKYNFLYWFASVLLVILWTNDFHHLFYKQYSIYFSETEFGPFLVVFTIWAYTLYILSVIKIVKSSMNKSGMITLQSVLVILGILIPLMGNFVGIFGIFNTTIYLQAILFAITILLYYLAIFRFKALNVVPIATKTIIDNMTDSFMVISEDGTIVDINKTCVDKFKVVVELKQNMNLFDTLKAQKSQMLKLLKKDIKVATTKKKTVTEEYHIQRGEFDKYLDIDIQPIKAKHGNEYVAILLLIRDITQEKKDIEIMTKNENLVILGELAGGVAHDINTPISAIKSGIMMLKPLSRNEDETMLLNSMDSCADKIIALVNSLRNQIRNIGSDEITDIAITNVLGDIKLILNNELKKNNVELELNIEDDIHIKGNPTKLSQVITNIVTNAIQAYEKKGGKVVVRAQKKKSTVEISVTDFASGIPERVRPYIFKNILTTKGVSGTGFGLYLAYSVIKGAFGGDITFETETGKGTTFVISIPIE